MVIDCDAIIEEFEKLKPIKRDVIIWLQYTFKTVKQVLNLIEYLERDDVCLRELYYYTEERKVIFYFKVYDRNWKKIKRKKIAIVPKGEMKLDKKYHTRGYGNNCCII